MICEKCWRDSGSNHEKYLELLDRRKEYPCSPEEQAGEYWDPIKQKDRRVKNG